MASTVDYHREMTQIYHTTAELLATQVNASTGQRVSLMAPFSPAVSEPMGSLGNHIRYITPAMASGAVVYSPVVDLQGTGLHLLSFGLRIRSGRLAISIVDPDSKSAVIAQLIRYHSQPMLQEKALIAAEGVRRVQILIWANNDSPQKTDFEIDSLQIAPAQWRPNARRAQ
jgi:hypothetical protein